MSADFYITIRIRCNNMVEHDHPNAEQIVRDVLKEESIVGCMEDEYEVLNVEPIR